MYTRFLLRAEGLAVFSLATAAFVWLDGGLWLYLLLILAPDLSMLGYLGGPKLGSATYNVFHTYLGPGALLAVAFWQAVPMGILVGLIWAAHIGADRTLAYGLKYPTSFTDTHLGTHVGKSGADPVTDPAIEPAD